MNRRLAALLTVAIAACSSPLPDATVEPTITPASTPVGALGAVSAARASPALADKSCGDFASPDDAQDFFIEAGGPDQDLHGLDPDGNGNACDEPSPTPNVVVPPASVSDTTSPPAGPTTPEPPPRPPKQYHSSSGAVEGKDGGSDSHSSCESSDAARCD